MGKIESIAENLFFPEGPRWNQRDSKLYFSDVLSSKVSRINEAGHVETVFEPGEFPSGLGFIQNGDLLVVATSSQEILRIPSELLTKGGLSRSDASHYADISTIYDTCSNDMVVKSDGTAYAGAYLPGLSESSPPGPYNLPRFGYIVMVNSEGYSQIVADRVCFPNGGIITPDGKTLIIAETF